MKAEESRTSMRILITGNMGYVGSVVSRHLRARFPDAVLFGFDSGLFGHCLTSSGALPESALDAQWFGDVRDAPGFLFDRVDAVVHLAAISNDPMGNRFAAATDEINHVASLRVAEQAHRAGVRAFVFASSCSVYGFAEAGARRESDPLDPLTAYARSKVATEAGLRDHKFDGMTRTCLRFATACGMSERLRLDLVLNDFVAGALASGEVKVLSDGTPWRPLIDVADMALAIEWAIGRSPDEGGEYLVLNVGSDERNHQVRDLAHAVADSIPGARVSIAREAAPDNRSYKVDFSLFRELAPEHQPRIDLTTSINRLLDGLRAINFEKRGEHLPSLIRLKVLRDHIDTGRLSSELRWHTQAGAL
jgi:nucleoside-diphosphate-sugar epimerase